MYPFWYIFALYEPQQGLLNSLISAILREGQETSRVSLMTLSGYRFGIRLSTLSGLVSLLVFLFLVDPEALSGWGMALFFICVGIVLSGIVTLSLLFLSERFVGTEGARLYVGSALRQGILCGSYVVVILLLLWREMFAWWIGGLFLAFFLLIEYTYRQVVFIHRSN